jgi:hypothetical protein
LPSNVLPNGGAFAISIRFQTGGVDAGRPHRNKSACA